MSALERPSSRVLNYPVRWPDELRAQGYEPEPIGEGGRILPTDTTQSLALTPSGAFEGLVEGST
jgi:hypothetical protein